MRAFVLFFVLIPLLAAPVAKAQDRDVDARIRNALSAAPLSVSQGAQVMEMNGTVLREGLNGWVCIPDDPALANNSPMCVDAAWLEFLDAWMKKRAPRVTTVGIGYMLQEDFPSSNTDPFATGPTPENQWVANSGPHIMVIFPNTSALAGYATDPRNGGPWVMWAGTPYAHVMVPAAPRR